jgi:Mn2+/Fe2+ NRAMP family transporter
MRKAPAGWRLTRWIKALGPGLITGAADDDPSGIATYSQVGAQYGFSLLWTIPVTYPLMVGIQIISARIGRVTGVGLSTNLRLHYPAWLMYGVIALLLVANTINIAADISAMGASMSLMLGGPTQLYAVAFGVLSLILQILIPYNRYVRLLKWLTLSLLAYVGAAFIAHTPWGQVLHDTLLPKLSWSRDYTTSVVAVFGTTISPYLFFWQASQEVEDLNASSIQKPLIEKPTQARSSFRRINLDTWIGMGFSNLVAFFIIVTTAQAAQALKPIAGPLAFYLFGAGIIGTGLLAVPVLAGSAAYAIAGAFAWKSSLELRFESARKFYSIIALSTLTGVGLGFTPIDPIKALFLSAVVNGVISVPIMVVMMFMASRKTVMKEFVLPPALRVLGWLATLVMGVAAVAMIVTM